jgi:hypothetical protein
MRLVPFSYFLHFLKRNSESVRQLGSSSYREHETTDPHHAADVFVGELK